MQANLTAVMDGLAALAAGIAPNIYAYPVESVSVPCVVIGYPTSITFDLTYQRGADSMEIPVFVLVGKTGTKDARDALSTIIGDTSSIKSALDGAHAFGDVRVMDATIDEVTVSAVAYLGVRFAVEII